MEQKATSRLVDIGVAVAMLAVAGGLAFAHHGQARARPEDSVARLFGALTGKDLGAVEAVLTRPAYQDFLRTFGTQKFERVQRAYDQAYRLGGPRWSELRRRANELAAQEYNLLRERAAFLGKEAFATLAVDARMQLIDDQDRYAAFLFERGVAALPEADRGRVGSANELRLGQDRDRFLDREGFGALPPEERALVGSAAALGEGQTPEKLALHDKFGLPMLPRALREEIGSITRAELADAPAFKLKYGEPLAKKFLQEHQFRPDPGLRTCTYPRADQHGSLLRGDEAVCSLAVQLQRTAQAVTIALGKQGFEWRIARIEPALNEIEW